MINLALFGAGRMAQDHALNIANLPGVRLKTIVDPIFERAQALAHPYGSHAAATPDAVFLDDDIHGIVIVSRTDTHAELTLQAAQKGVPVFCEKPVDRCSETIRRCVGVLEETKTPFFLGFNRRFDPSFAKARELVASGKIGTPHIVRVTSRDPAPPPLEYLKVSGGIFLDMTIHDFDMVRFLSGSEAVEVYAVGDALVDPEIGRTGDVDTCIVTMRLENGALATIDNSRKAVYGYDQRVEVFGSAGMVSVSNRTPDHHVLSNADGVHSAKPQHFFLERYDEAYVRELQAFVDCIEQDTAPTVTGVDGLKPVIMGLAAKKSLAENRPVKLNEIS